jgi:hypothetical protein
VLHVSSFQYLSVLTCHLAILFISTQPSCLSFRYVRCTRSVSIGRHRCINYLYAQPEVLTLVLLMLFLSHVLQTVPPAYYAHLAAFRARHYLDDGLSDQGSLASSSRLHDRAVPVIRLPGVKENVNRFMFYC